MEEVSLNKRPYDMNMRGMNEYLLKIMPTKEGQELIGFHLHVYEDLVNKNFKSPMMKAIINTFIWAETSNENYWINKYYHPDLLDEHDLKAIQTAYERDFFFIVPAKQLEGIEEAFL